MRAIWIVRRRTLVWTLVGLAGILGGVALAAIPHSVQESFLWQSDVGLSLCGVPGLPDPAASSAVAAGSLPWKDSPPPELRELQRAHAAHILIGAYQIRVLEPLFQEAANVERGAALLRGAVIEPGGVLSFNERVGPYTPGRGFRDGPEYRAGRVVPSPGGGICKVSSALFNAAILAGLRVVERHPHSMLVAYVPAGQDAAVAYPYKDLRLGNQQEGPVVVWTHYGDATVTVALYGSYQPPQVRWSHRILERAPYPHVRQRHPDLPAGQERVAVRGLDGVRLRSWLTVVYPDGAREEIDLGVTLYRPRPQVVEYGA